VDQKTLEELGWSTEKDENGKFKIDFEKLSKEKQQEIAKTRAKNQMWAFRDILENGQAVHRMAIGMAAQLTNKSKITERYTKHLSYLREQNMGGIPKKNVVLNLNTHGLFVESLLKEAGYMKKEGQKIDFKSKEFGEYIFESKEFGGYIQPTESIFLEEDNASGDFIVSFEGEGRPSKNNVYVSKEKIIELSNQYLEHTKQFKK